ncbi:MAG: hypothetical protein JWP99_584, partial [Devosia sp.]|nr:hypothetical protein [Devosia sp.]
IESLEPDDLEADVTWLAADPAVGDVEEMGAVPQTAESTPPNAGDAPLLAEPEAVEGPPTATEAAAALAETAVLVAPQMQPAQIIVDEAAITISEIGPELAAPEPAVGQPVPQLSSAEASEPQPVLQDDAAPDSDAEDEDKEAEPEHRDKIVPLVVPEPRG